jgi:hypothetical protein
MWMKIRVKNWNFFAQIKYTLRKASAERQIVHRTKVKDGQYLHCSPQQSYPEFHSAPAYRGLLDRSTARYFYKGPKTSLHKHTGNLVENLFSKKCAFENYLQLDIKVFVSNNHNTLKWPFTEQNSYFSKIFNISVYDGFNKIFVK